jgi:hypothetical protein
VSDVLELIGRLGDIGAHKGVIVTTIGFQEGAIKLAQSHDIALAVTVPVDQPEVVGFDWVAKCRTATWEKRPHGTVALWPGMSSKLPFAEAWRTIVAGVFREIIWREVEEGRFRLVLRCASCQASVETFLRGVCRSCRQPLQDAPLDDRGWYTCRCGTRAYHVDVDTTFGFCACGAPKSIASLNRCNSSRFVKCSANIASNSGDAHADHDR